MSGVRSLIVVVATLVVSWSPSFAALDATETTWDGSEPPPGALG